MVHKRNRITRLSNDALAQITPPTKYTAFDYSYVQGEFGKLVAALAEYEDAEEAGYIKRCPWCGSLSVEAFAAYFVHNGSEVMEVQYHCIDCQQEFGAD